ncbi:YfbU family protein [Phaeovulum sp. NW3]|uniref:YfbU family protein n=1 Tax=Phaeovulum sp. NW3 TaxID=2934933 RepID=UPI0020208B9C|nr:YfbU family protein [Phaeovulum sp. NW3]MCL7465584.1 YfbU family protein [Phaeovulum sp. NW3]
MSTFNNFERLTIALGADRALGKDYFVDAKLVGELVTSGNEWALHWEYDWLSKEPHVLDEVVDETVRIFEMFRHLQTSAEQSGHREVDTTFEGFDFNNDKHAGVARVLVEKLDRFDGVKGATNNSHSIVSIDRYRRMLAVYEPILKAIQGATYRTLNKDEIDQVLDRWRGK